MDADHHSPIAQPRSESSLLSKLALLHFCALVIFTSWAFGGQAPWVRQIIAIFGGFGVLLFIFLTARARTAPGPKRSAVLRFLWPLWLYDVVVIASCFNPSFRETGSGANLSLVMVDPIPWLPSSARPALAARELWQFNVIVLSCFNLFLAAAGRRVIRIVLLVMAANGVVLAIFGTFQKLAGYKGLWLGLVTSPNDKFFATFIYHNHWGPFTLMNAAICLGLFFYYLRRGGPRNFWHSPALTGAVLTLLLAISVPLSASRSCSVLIAVLLFAALAHLLIRVARRRRERHESVIPAIVGITLAAVLALGVVGYLGRNVIAQRAQLTSEQIAHISQESALNARLALYRDTWTMASAKPVFGWGLESYAYVFRVFNTQRTAETVFWIPFYAEAHNDWLQSLAEVGFVGTILLGLLLGLPLASVPWRQVESVMPRYLLGGCVLVLLYAWVEFPFANPAVMMTFFGTFYCAIRYAMADLRAQEESR